VPRIPLLLDERKGKTVLRLLLFRAGDGVYAVPFGLLKEVVGTRGVTDLPILGGLWDGIFFIRGICHGLLKIPDLRAAEPRRFDRVILLRHPERCGLGASEIIGDFPVPLKAVEISSAGTVSEPIEISGRLKWKGHEAKLVDIDQVLRRSLGRRVDEGQMGQSRQSEPLMRSW